MNNSTVYPSPVYQTQSSEFDQEHLVWPPALDYSSQPLSTTAQPYNWHLKFDNSVVLHDLRSSVDILQPAPTRHIDAKYLETQSASQSPEMVHPSMNQQPLYHVADHQHHLVPEYEYEPTTHYYDAHVETSPSISPEYYSSVQPSYYHGGNLAYSVLSPYAHMQPSCPPTSYMQSYPTALYGYSPPETRRNSYAIYTPASSNPSSGTTSPQFEHLDTPYEYETEALPTPVTPTTLSRTRMPANLLLAQAGITSEPVTVLSSYHSQEAMAPFETRLMHPESHFQTPTPYQPMSPVSPVLEHPVATSEVFPEATVSPTSVTPTTTFVVESGQAEEKLAEDLNGDAQAQAQAAERLKKLRERRHVIACSFCRGRKIACHSPVRVTQDEDDEIPESVMQSSAQDDEYTPKATSSSRRAQPAGIDRPPCDNCVRRGRECVYPPRVPRVPRRRRKAATAAPAPVAIEQSPSQYPSLTINTHLLQ